MDHQDVSLVDAMQIVLQVFLEINICKKIILTRYHLHLILSKALEDVVLFYQIMQKYILAMHFIQAN